MEQINTTALILGTIFLVIGLFWVRRTVKEIKKLGPYRRKEFLGALALVALGGGENSIWVPAFFILIGVGGLFAAFFGNS